MPAIGSYAEYEFDQMRRDRIEERALRKHATFMSRFSKYTGDLHEILYKLAEGEHESLTDSIALAIEQAFTARTAEEKTQAYIEIGALLSDHVSNEVFKECLSDAYTEDE